jgi:hypothetical protein
VSETTEVKRFDGETLGFLMEEKNRLTALRPQILDEGDVDALDELDGTIEEIDKAIMAMSMAVFAREEARSRYKKWEAIVPQCRAALKRYEEVCRDLEKAIFKTAELESRASHAFDVVMQVRDQRPRNEVYPTEAEIEAHEARERKAEAVHKERVAKLVEAKDRQAVLTREQWETRNALGDLQFRERQLRPQQDAQPAKLVSAVR